MQQEHRQAKPSRAGSGTGRAALAAAAVMLALTVWGRGPSAGFGRGAGGPSARPAHRPGMGPAGGRGGPRRRKRRRSPGLLPRPPRPHSDPTAIERYLVPLLTDADKPADAGAVTETSYGQGSGEKYIAWRRRPIKNNTSVSAAEVAAEVQNPLPFSIELNSPDPQVLIMHTHATECYAPAEGLWFLPGDGARTTDRGRQYVRSGGRHGRHPQRRRHPHPPRRDAERLPQLHPAAIPTAGRWCSSTWPSTPASRWCWTSTGTPSKRGRHPRGPGGRGERPQGRPGHADLRVRTTGPPSPCPTGGRTCALPPPGRGPWKGCTPGFTRPVLFSYRFYNQDLTTGSLLIEMAPTATTSTRRSTPGSWPPTPWASLFTGAG